MTGTGWTSRQVDETPWPDVKDLLNYWKEYPPVHILVRPFFAGGGSSDGKVYEEPDEEQLAQGITGIDFGGPQP